MTREELEKEYQRALKELIDYHSEQIKNMTQEEEYEYIKENKLNEKIEEMKKRYQEKYKALENK